MLLCWISFTTAAASERLVTLVRIAQPFPETLEVLKTAIAQQGYTVTRVQKVDYGLEKLGFETDEYQLVFFGKTAEILRLPKQQPDLIPFLPLKIIIFAEGLDTLLLSDNYISLAKMYNDSALTQIFHTWRSDVQKIFINVKQSVQK